MIKFGLALAILFSSHEVLAQGAISAGDGGHGVVCSTKSTEYSGHSTVELLDLFEARRLFYKTRLRESTSNEHLALDLYKAGTCAILKNKRKFFAEVFGSSHRILHAFDQACKIKLTVATEIPRTFDSGPMQLALPRNCELVQLAVRRIVSGKPTVSLHYEYVDYLTQTDAAAILLHEALHNFFHNSSTIAIRQFVGYTFGKSDFRRRNVEAIKELVSTRKEVDIRLFK